MVFILCSFGLIYADVTMETTIFLNFPCTSRAGIRQRLKLDKIPQLLVYRSACSELVQGISLNMHRTGLTVQP